MNTEKLKQKIIAFTVESVEAFLLKHPNLQFYAFAFDCNAEDAQIHLSFNTEQDFAETLLKYQQNSPEIYFKEWEIDSLKYNSGDWGYSCFETLYVLSDEEIQTIFEAMPEDDYKSWKAFVEGLMCLFCESLMAFTKTETFEKIPKSNNLKTICTDHDEDLDDAEKRMEKIRNLLPMT